MAEMSPPADLIAEARSRVSAHEQLLIDTAAQLVRIPSANPINGESQAVEYVCDWLERHVQLTHSLEAKVEGRPNVIARLDSGRPGRTLMLSGHLDTKDVGEPEAWSHDPLAGDVVGGRLRGRGSADMKASVAAMLIAAKTIRALDSWDGSLLLVFTADEEAGGTLGARYLSEFGSLTADAGIVGEPAGLTTPYEFIALACRGGCWIETRIQGRGGHSSLARPLNMLNPNHRIGSVIADMLAKFRVAPDQRHPLYPDGILYNLGAKVTGGDGPGTVPHETVILSEVRIPPGVTRADVEEAVAAYQKAAPEGVSVRLVKHSDGVEIAPEERVARSAAASARAVLGRQVPFRGYPAGTDAVHFIARAAIPCVTAFGPGVLAQAHVPDESIDLESVIAASHMYTLAALDYLADQ